MKHIVSRMSSYFPNRWPLSYLNLIKNMKTYIWRQRHKKKTEKLKHIQKLLAGFLALDKGGLSVLNFVRHYSTIYSTIYRLNVNTRKYALLGSQMLKLARLVVINSKTTKTMFFDCARHLSGSVSFNDSVIQNV